MAKNAPTRFLGSIAQWVGVAVCVALGLALFAFVDLNPEVGADFFFSKSDPQLRDSLRIEKEFGEARQIFVAARSRALSSQTYLVRLRNLTADLKKVKGVIDAKSITHGPEKPEKVAKRDADEVYEDLLDSPFWTRLLLAPDRSASFIVLQLENKNWDRIVTGIDQVLAKHERQGFDLAVSGVPYVSEQLRRRLSSELYFFSIVAFVAFAVLITVLFRSVSVLLGTMVAALSASFGTFLVRAAFGMHTDLLAPNLWTIAFVLTLSHTAYLTAQWQRQAAQAGSEKAAREAVRLMAPASAWSLLANLLGFASLIFVEAKPLRQFGVSGGIAAVLAMACAFVLFPPFLKSAQVRKKEPGAIERFFEGFFTRRHSFIAVSVILVAIAVAPFALRVNSDPSLPSYFSTKDPIRTGLEAIDRSAGSSPMDIVVADARGEPLDNDRAFARLESLQYRLERHRDVGSVLSVALLMRETDRQWYSFLFSWDRRLKELDKPKHDEIGKTFLSADRKRGRYLLRMREGERSRPRQEVVAEIKGIVRQMGFQPVLVGGLYVLQDEMSRLVEASIIRGLGGLIALFFVIVLIVSRSVRTSLAMALCLAMTSFLLFGFVGLIGMPMDIISAPAANVALPLGIDEMIHLGYLLRRERSGKDPWAAWKKALADLWRPILASMLIVTSGFSLFLLSQLPPTQRLGVLVCAGAALTDLAVLVVLPAVATWGRRRSKEKDKTPVQAKAPAGSAAGLR